MTKEEKELLLKDLCARLYTGTVVNYNDTEGCDYPLTIRTLSNFPEEKLKCYLRPMSSMTDEEKEEYDGLLMSVNDGCENTDYMPYSCMEYVDWLNAHHFDYKGLIKKGLALPAPEGMYE